MKTIFASAALMVLVASAASAQGIEVGPGGVRLDTGRDRVITREYRDGDRYERRDRRFSREERCRTVVTRRENRFGEMVTRRTRECS